MSAWDELLAATHPGKEVEAGSDVWLVVRRSYTHPDSSIEGRDDRMTITVELVRSGSDADPRRPPPDAPRPTTTRED